MPEYISDNALFNDPEHLEFLGRQRKGLVDFVDPHVCSPDGGYTWIGDDGLPITSKGKQLWIGARMIHVFCRHRLSAVSQVFPNGHLTVKAGDFHGRIVSQEGIPTPCLFLTGALQQVAVSAGFS